MPLKVEEWSIERLTPYARNPRKNDEAVTQMVAAIKEFGFRIPIVALSDGTVIDGHLRLKAAIKSGLKNVPVALADELSPTQIKAFRLLANRSASWAEWDEELLRLEFEDLSNDGFDLDMTGFNSDEIDKLLAGIEKEIEGSGESDGLDYKIPEPPTVAVTQPGDLWILGEHRLLCGDSLNEENVIRLMNGERAKLFATDPPYLINYSGASHPAGFKRVNKERDEKRAEGKQISEVERDWSTAHGTTWDSNGDGDEFFDRLIKIAVEHAIDERAAWYCWHAYKKQMMVESSWERAGAFVHQQIIWKKNNKVMGRALYMMNHEPCLFGWMRGKTPHHNKDSGSQATVWEIDSLLGDERPDHPTPKPLDCFAIPMRMHIRPGDVCYEPFSGSGSQIIAGENARCKVYAMELSPNFVDVAVKRYIKATGRIVYLDGSGGKTFETVAAERNVSIEE
ncbi:MAG: DNA modification methylase [Magnetococcales bacterium]|nr:DNA modification methylase [Magnetococcales bacterium]